MILALLTVMSISVFAQDNIDDKGFANSPAGFKEMTQNGVYGHVTYSSVGLYTADGKTLVRAIPQAWDTPVWIFFVKAGCTTIAPNAFGYFSNQDASNKFHVYMPASVTSIATNAFGMMVYDVGIYDVDESTSKYDVNDDGSVNVSDVTAIVNEILK